MAKQNNIFTIEGIIYSKPSRIVKSKKDGKEYEFKSIILEIKGTGEGKSSLPEFQFGFGVDDNGFDVGDNVEVTFSLVGKLINKDWHKTELKALYIKHPDIQGNDTRDVKGEPMNKKKKEEVFVAPNPDGGEDDLPF